MTNSTAIKTKEQQTLWILYEAYCSIPAFGQTCDPVLGMQVAGVCIQISAASTLKYGD